MGNARYVSLLVVAVILVNGNSCARSDSSNQTPEGRLVTKAEFGDEWPFTVDSGYVDCPDGLSAVFRTGSAEFGLNGMATSRGFAEPDPIRKDDPIIPGAKISIGPMIDLARQECK
jgi:hypothetical protein